MVAGFCMPKNRPHPHYPAALTLADYPHLGQIVIAQNYLIYLNNHTSTVSTSSTNSHN